MDGGYAIMGQAAENRAWFAKLDVDGNLEWQHLFAPELTIGDDTRELHDIDQATSGEFCVVGQTDRILDPNPNAPHQDGYIARLGPDRAVLWELAIDGGIWAGREMRAYRNGHAESVDVFTSVVAGEDGGCYAAGPSRALLSADNDAFNSQTRDRTFSALARDGQLLWLREDQADADNPTRDPGRVTNIGGTDVAYVARQGTRAEGKARVAVYQGNGTLRYKQVLEVGEFGADTDNLHEFSNAPALPWVHASFTNDSPDSLTGARDDGLLVSVNHRILRLGRIGNVIWERDVGERVVFAHQFCAATSCSIWVASLDETRQQGSRWRELEQENGNQLQEFAGAGGTDLYPIRAKQIENSLFVLYRFVLTEDRAEDLEQNDQVRRFASRFLGGRIGFAPFQEEIRQVESINAQNVRITPLDQPLAAASANQRRIEHPVIVYAAELEPGIFRVAGISSRFHSPNYLTGHKFSARVDNRSVSDIQIFPANNSFDGAADGYVKFGNNLYRVAESGLILEDVRQGSLFYTEAGYGVVRCTYSSDRHSELRLFDGDGTQTSFIGLGGREEDGYECDGGTLPAGAVHLSNGEIFVNPNVLNRLGYSDIIQKVDADQQLLWSRKVQINRTRESRQYKSPPRMVARRNGGAVLIANLTHALPYTLRPDGTRYDAEPLSVDQSFGDNDWFYADWNSEDLADVVLIYLDSQGNVDRTDVYGGAGNDLITHASGTEDGGFLLVGRSTSFGDRHDAWVLRLGPDGELADGCNAFLGSIPTWHVQSLEVGGGLVEPVDRGTRTALGDFEPIDTLMDPQTTIIDARQCFGTVGSTALQPPVNDPVELSLTFAGSEGGLVTSLPGGVHCSNPNETCTTTWSRGAIVTLRVDDNDANRFRGWDAQCPDVRLNPHRCVVTLDADTNIDVFFETDDGVVHTLDISTMGNGRILSTDISPQINCPAIVRSGVHRPASLWTCSEISPVQHSLQVTHARQDIV